jgi:hypothetical protein
LRKTFATEFPDYAALSNPLPITAREIQALLSVHEAMIVFAVVDDESYVFALTRDAYPAFWGPFVLIGEGAAC